MSRTTVVYLSGFGRSGSTLVERMLGAAPAWVNVGELVDLARSVARTDELCGCGEPFSRCPVWTQVGEAAFGGWTADVLDRLARRAALCRPPATPAGPPGSTTSGVRCSRRAAEGLRGHLPSGRRGDRLRRRRRRLQGPGARRRAGRSPRRGPADAQRRPRPTGSGLVVAPPRRPTARHVRKRADVADPGSPVRGAVECAPAGGGGHRVRRRSAGRPHPLRGPGGRPGADPRHRDGNAGRAAGSCRPAVDGGDVVLQPSHGLSGNPGRFRSGRRAVAARRPMGHRDACVVPRVRHGAHAPCS